MKIIQWIVVPLMVAVLAAIAATLILYQVIALAPNALARATCAAEAALSASSRRW